MAVAWQNSDGVASSSSSDGEDGAGFTGRDWARQRRDAVVTEMAGELVGCGEDWIAMVAEYCAGSVRCSGGMKETAPVA